MDDDIVDHILVIQSVTSLKRDRKIVPVQCDHVMQDASYGNQP